MQNLALVNDDTEVEVRLRATASDLCEAAGNVVIFTRPDLSHATDLVKAIKDRAKAIEDARTEMVGPLNDHVKRINARFKSMLVPLQEAEQELKGKMLAFQQEEARKAEVERKRLEEEQRKREGEERAKRAAEEAKLLAESTDGEEQDRAPMPVVETPAPAPVVSTFKPTTYGQTGATSTVKKQWTFEVLAIGEVPNEYLLIDQVKVNQAIRAGMRDIPGLRVYEKEVIAIR